MPTLEFKGKPFVYAHHLSVPFRELVIDAGKSLPGPGGPSLDDNLVIHGDNLEALKALLPRYAGKVDVVCIDPPYNTGNEGWEYNDNVSSPQLRQWIGQVVDRDDMERHDKWLCMMWPRLQLLRELMSDAASIWVFCDDNEMSRLVQLMEEVFGADNFLGVFVWEKSDSPKMDVQYFSSRHDYVVCFAKELADVRFQRLNADDEDEVPDHYDKEDESGRPYYLKPLRAMGSGEDTREARPTMYFPLVAPDGSEILPKKPDGTDGRWRWSPEKAKREKDRIEWIEGRNGWAPYFRIFADTGRGRPPETIWSHQEVGSNRTSKAELKAILGEATFQTPKPTKLIERILAIASSPSSLVLDSFAGSGTTMHAILAANRKDGGKRKGILIECESYADKVTAERIRRIARGIPKSKDSALRNGLGGSFTFCDLGDSLDLERFFDGETRPSWEQVARYVAFTATGETIGAIPKEPPSDWFVGEASGYRIHLLYRPDLAFMRSADAAISANLADSIMKANSRGKPVLLYAAAAFVSQRELGRRGITFCQLPYAIHRLLGDGPTGSAG